MTYDPCAEGNEEELMERIGQIENDTEVVDLVRNNAGFRRQVSQFMLSSRLCDGKGALQLRQRLAALWMDLLRLPDPVQQPALQYKISLIIPAYKEAHTVVADTLSSALHQCCHPKYVQVILVVSPSMEATAPHHQESGWGAVKTVVYDGHGGRGPCHNAGAQHATGEILTFLHADTIMAPRWDVRVQAALLSRKEGVRTQACAFAFGHNIEGGKPYPWGIRSVWLLGNLRSYVLSLPYGDHIISVPSTIFRYVGGFPHQPIMEDYVLMDLFRKRARVLCNGEQIAIIPPPGGKCSVRRWQQLGVVYVTLVNALMVHRYVHGGWTAQDIFQYYYRRPFAKKSR